MRRSTCLVLAVSLEIARTSATPDSGENVTVSVQPGEPPVHVVDDGYVSFALDMSFVFGGPDCPFEGVVADWQNPLLRKVVSLVHGGYLRLGGTYTDFLHYAVPGSNYTRCPLPKSQAVCGGYPSQIPNRAGNGPCCLTLTMDRWNETLEFAHATGLKVALNLNILAGRMPLGKTSGALPWDSTEAEALLVWTRDNIAAEKWPAYWGLGNELLDSIIPPAVYASDIATLHALVDKVFGSKRMESPATPRPSIYAPCGDNSPSGYTALLEYLKANGTTLDAWSWHAYSHGENTVESMSSALYGGSLAAIGASGAAYSQFNATNPPALRPLDERGHPSASWVTETAWAARPPANCSGAAGSCSGATASIDPMLRAMCVPKLDLVLISNEHTRLSRGLVCLVFCLSAYLPTCLHVRLFVMSLSLSFVCVWYVFALAGAC